MKYVLGGALILAGSLGACAPGPQAEIERSVLPNASQGRNALAPLEYVRFCLTYAEDCAAGTPHAVVTLTPETKAAIEGINRDVNARIRPRTGLGEWRVDPSTGNCNDYVVTKRHELLRLGLPASALLITVVQMPTGEGHLLLIVRTDRGEFVLDNLTSEMKLRGQTSYVWKIRQSSAGPMIWERM